MRSREELQQLFDEFGSSPEIPPNTEFPVMLLQIQLEVLLDIRELLVGMESTLDNIDERQRYQ